MKSVGAELFRDSFVYVDRHIRDAQGKETEEA